MLHGKQQLPIPSMHLATTDVTCIIISYNNLLHLHFTYPNSIGIKYSLLLLGGGYLHHVSVLNSLLVKS